MAESLVEDLYAALASVKEPQKKTGSSPTDVEKSSQSVEDASVQNLGGRSRNELPVKKKSKSLRNETDVDKQKCEGFSKKKANISKHHEHTVPHIQDQTLRSEDISEQQMLSRRNRTVSENSHHNVPCPLDHTAHGNEKQKGDERREEIRPNCSEFDHGWYKAYTHLKDRNRCLQFISGRQKEEASSSSVGQKAGDYVQTGAGHNVYHMEGEHYNEGSRGPRAQTEEREAEGRRKEGKFGLGYRQLEKLAGEDPSEIVLFLANSRAGFETLLKQPLRPDLLILIVRILSKLCKAVTGENKAAVLSYACVYDFLDQLSKHIAVIPLEVNKVRKDDVGGFLDDLMTFLETVINLLPSKAVEGFGNVFMMTDVMIKVYEGQELRFSDFEEVKKKFEHVRASYKMCVEEQESKDMTESTNAFAVEAPPNDFREINVFPDPKDILSEEPGFVRPNIICGAYGSVDDYLDTQFRLLREDFVAPLREGIAEYRGMVGKKRLKEITSMRIYPKVYFCKSKIIFNLKFFVRFDPDKCLQKENWEHSKRFMLGSLLLFSRDNFKNIILATVMSRNLKYLKDGIILVQLSKNSEFADDLFDSDVANYEISDAFVMAESQVYFEPYYHVLKALQNMTQGSFPMEKYIIHAEVLVDPPKYTCSQGGALLNIYGHSVCVLEDSSWPTPLELKLDNSQFQAFKSALTKEFVVLQGPPGTGKTFLGLKVATVLLENAPIWNASRAPMLVVCYTNHALDQFLEGLVPVTDSIVRVGGRSKSKVLESMNLREKRGHQWVYRNVFDHTRDIDHRMSGSMSAIEGIENALKMITSHRGIVSLSVLREARIIQDQHLGCFASQYNLVSDKLFTEWLEYGMYDDVPPCEAEANHGQNLGQNVDGKNSDAEECQDDVDDMQCHMLGDMMDWELETVLPNYCLRFALDLSELERNIKWYFYVQIEDLKLRLNYIRRQLGQEGGLDRRTVERLLQEGNLWQLQAQERWILYRYWMDRLRNVLQKELNWRLACFRCEARMYEGVQQMNDLDILRESLIVGMTTTGAAKFQSLLQALKPKIVIIEEAAEVLESHIVASLTHHCEHLILIGDHQQLRPSPAVFRLARDFNLDISLFERMLKNGMHCDMLKVQHRMRPEVAELIVPSIYPELLNHSSVQQYETICGMLKSVFFITHNHPEEEVEDTSSHRNTHEGDFLIALCRYLVLQGYLPSRITILATYSGQMFYLRSVQTQHSILREVKITVVDNFQGEENDIILLSLVRSNSAAKIGFLKTENRVCVALSRAKMGFYIIGNMDSLTRSSKIWPKIKETLQKQDALGTHLTLRCQVHPSVFTRVSTATDFHKVPEGGCLHICGTTLPCGHKCKSFCHVINREHGNVRCSERCERVPARCKLQHRCSKLCCEPCGDCRTSVRRTLPCGHTLDLFCCIDPEKHKCPVKVEVELPACGHKVEKPCHMDTDRVNCPYPCEDRLLCDHNRIMKCHKKDDPDHLEYLCTQPCTRKNAGCKEDHMCTKQCHEECGDCRIHVKRKLPHCEHSVYMFCCVDPETYLCKRKCNRILPCEHPCPNLCSDKCGNCQVMVVKQIDECGHFLDVKCCEMPDPKLCESRCNKLLQCGHKCTTRCSTVCTQECRELVPCAVRPACGHLVHVPCYMQNQLLDPYSEDLLSRCQMPCDAFLMCNHRCRGTCGECMQGRIHVACKEKCGKTLICGHSCNVPCAQSCPPCSRKCTYTCKHSGCSKSCGQPCVQCKEPCDWSCIHHRCKKLCYELCDRKPCNEPCTELLPCKHPCIGFCGEPCPPLCRVCNKDEVTEVFFGTEDEPDARFIYLEDCKHVLEATGLEQWMSLTDGEIKLKDCPKCKTPIAKTQRFMNMVKKVYQDVQHVKSHVLDNKREIEASRAELRKRLFLVNEYADLLTESTEFRNLYKKLLNQLQPVQWKKVDVLSIIDTATLRVQTEIFSQVVECYRNMYTHLTRESKDKIISHMDMLLRVVRKQGKTISGQEIDDINMEIQRFHRVCQLHRLKSETEYRISYNDPEVKIGYEAAHRIAYTIEKYSAESDGELRNALENLSKVMNSAVKITDAERKEIVRAMGYKQGHWYKCPNGHIYIITECGGARETSRCNECGEEIGGGSHRLLPTNSVATEMDGATRPAWPQ